MNEKVEGILMFLFLSSLAASVVLISIGIVCLGNSVHHSWCPGSGAAGTMLGVGFIPLIGIASAGIYMDSKKR